MATTTAATSSTSSSSSSSSSSSWHREMEKLVGRLITRRDSEPFRDPVPYLELNLVDYLDIVKKPMDLGTVKTRLASNHYKHLHECAAEVRLIWSNAMLYNLPNSPIYMQAKGLSDAFESQYTSIASSDKDRPPTKDEMLAWSEKCFSLTEEQLGKVILDLEKACPKCVSRNEDGTEFEINVDMMSGAIFRAVNKVVQKYLPDFEIKKAKRKAGVAPPAKGIENGTNSAAKITNITTATTSSIVDGPPPKAAKV